jgi:transcriptional regulator with XRE-family HTH domain
MPITHESHSAREALLARQGYAPRSSRDAPQNMRARCDAPASSRVRSASPAPDNRPVTSDKWAPRQHRAVANTLRNRPVDVGRERGRELVRRFGDDCRTARISLGLSQRLISRRAAVSQGLVSRVERGLAMPSIDLAGRLAAALGGELRLWLSPGPGVGLRDSGQLRVAQLVRDRLHPSLRVAFEVPVGVGADRRAADMVIESSMEVVVVEIERRLADFQAQHRAWQLKRRALAEQLGRSARLLVVVTDTRRNREVTDAHASLIEDALPLRSRAIWAALSSGEPLKRDGLLWARDTGLSRQRITPRAGSGSRGR